MNKIQFAVSAKTARLIGRENITDVDGAMVELIKNSYDADATCVFVLFNIPFPTIPQTISYELFDMIFGKTSGKDILHFYKDSGACLCKNPDLSKEDEKILSELLFSKNSIIIMDNGYGMDENILRTAWMNIGTSDKEEKRVSPKGRVKTGAKGIGRFALDKLSTSTTVYTKNENDSLKKWQIDWEQFETASLLDEVTATIDECDRTFCEYASNIAKGHFKGFNNYNWDTGTIISLTPTREVWSEKYFLKVNNNLKSLFPGTNDSQFDIYISNIYYPQFSFENDRFLFSQSEYDYKILGEFNGDNEISVSIQRNEIDTRKLKVAHIIGDEEKIFSLSEFWDRDAFKKENYKRADFAKTIKRTFIANSLTGCDLARLQSVGPFSLELYFLKNASSKIEIAKPVVSQRRKEILADFSGIKLYRDGFKVRPYGESDGPSFDWLSLGLRVQKSPAAVSHQSGSWRVRSNQIIGAVRITKDNNPNLEDMANREGLAVNDAYRTFIKIIDKILETFESDRQYVYKEYASWIKAKEDAVSNIANIIETAQKNKDHTNKTDDTTHADDSSNGGYSKADYEQAILELEESRKRQERANKTMMLYSSAGVMTNTFSHEISRIMTHSGSRMQHLRNAVKRALGKDYEGIDFFNPFLMIEQIESVDKLLENWLELLMSGTEDEVFSKKEVNIYTAIDNILTRWKPLLQKKLITVEPIEVTGDEANCYCNISEIDLIIVLNNFLLNSADFLEKASVDVRKINVSITEKADRIIVDLENNGPPLNGIFASNPDKIFDAGVSTKIMKNGKKGSGIGLWITQMIVHDNSGSIHVLEKQNGFGIRISLPK